jgi:hypothetical protein
MQRSARGAGNAGRPRPSRGDASGRVLGISGPWLRYAAPSRRSATLAGGRWLKTATCWRCSCNGAGTHKRPSQAAASSSKAVRRSPGGASRLSSSATGPPSASCCRGARTASSGTATTVPSTHTSQRGNRNDACRGLSLLGMRNDFSRHMGLSPNTFDRGAIGFPRPLTGKKCAQDVTCGGR